eukprot:scaffold7948_cov286-Pinguiococcus_pyrenoidosus.AAC.1
MATRLSSWQRLRFSDVPPLWYTSLNLRHHQGAAPSSGGQMGNTREVIRYHNVDCGVLVGRTDMRAWRKRL